MIRTTVGPALLAIGLALSAIAGLAAHADEDDWRRRDFRDHEWRDHEWREHEWREHYYPPPPLVYAPMRPAYIAPPLVVGVPNAFNIVVPLNMR